MHCTRNAAICKLNQANGRTMGPMTYTGAAGAILLCVFIECLPTILYCIMNGTEDDWMGRKTHFMTVKPGGKIASAQVMKTVERIPKQNGTSRLSLKMCLLGGFKGIFARDS